MSEHPHPGFREDEVRPPDPRRCSGRCSGGALGGLQHGQASSRPEFLLRRRARVRTGARPLRRRSRPKSAAGSSVPASTDRTPRDSARPVTTRREPTPWSSRPSSCASAAISSAPPKPSCTGRSPRVDAWCATIRTARRIATSWFPPRTASVCIATTAPRSPCCPAPTDTQGSPPTAPIATKRTCRTASSCCARDGEHGAPSPPPSRRRRRNRPAGVALTAGLVRRLDRFPPPDARQRRLSRGAGPVRGGRQSL